MTGQPAAEVTAKGDGALLAGWFSNDAHILLVRVYYEDTDFSGIVYHANYLRYFERGRTDCLRLAGIDQSRLHQEADGFAFAVRRMALDFRKPARMDDRVRVETRLERVRGASLSMEQRLFRAGDEAGADLLVGAQIEVCAVRDGRPARIPAALRASLDALARRP